MVLRSYFILFNYLLALLAALCLFNAEVFSPLIGILSLGLIVLLAWMEWNQYIPVKPPPYFSVIKIALVGVPIIYFTLRPEIADLASGLLMFLLLTRFCYKTELNDYLYGHLISIVCLLIGALFIRDLTFGLLFIAFYLTLCWALIFYNLMVERLGSRSAPDEFRGAGLHEKTGASLFGLTGSLLILSLLLTTAIFISFPRFGLGFIAIDSGASHLSGFSDRVQLGEVGQIKQNQEVVMRVQMTRHGQPFRPRQRVLWRGVALDHYDGRTWTSTAPPSWSIRHKPGHPVSLFSVDNSELVVRQEVFMEAVDTPVVFTFGLPLKMDGTFRGLTMDPSFIFETTDPTLGPRRFDIVADIGQENATGFAFPITGGMDPRELRRYRQLPPMSPRFRQLAGTLTQALVNPLDRAQAILNFFNRGFTYSLTMKQTTDLSAIDEFLFHRRSGHCEYFASAMALLLRQAGIPARVINGFMGVEYNEMGDYLMIRQSHAHSWVEAYFPGKGWKVFDPTPTDPGLGAESPGRLSLYMDLMRLYWQRYVVKYNLGDQMRIVRYFTRETQGLKNSLKSLQSLHPREWLSALKQHASMAGLMLVILAFGLWASRRFWLTWLKGAEPLPPAARHYHAMVRKLGRSGWIKQPEWTAREFLNHLEGLPADRKQTVETITDLYERSRFGGAPLRPEESQRLRECVKSL